jgi:hypothetical protein
MRRLTAALSSASGLCMTAASSAWENSRPIAAPICATSLAGPSRSSRAISEACKLAGTAKAVDGTVAAVRCASSSLPASNTALVISSTNSGMPSMRSMMSCRTFAAAAASSSRWKSRRYRELRRCAAAQVGDPRQQSSHLLRVEPADDAQLSNCWAISPVRRISMTRMT